MSFNQSLFQIIYSWSHRSPLLDDLGIFIAEYLPYLMVAGFLYFAFARKDARMRILIFCEGALGIIFARGIVVEVIRFFYHHLRPFDTLGFVPLVSAGGYSFPSGHAAWFFALSLTLFYYSRKWGMWYIALSALNGIARIYVGVHWPLDIIAGIAVGLLCGIFAHALVKSSLRSIRPLERSAS